VAAWSAAAPKKVSVSAWAEQYRAIWELSFDRMDGYLARLNAKHRKTNQPTTDNPPNSVVIERTLDAPVEMVWKLWTESEHFAAWYGPQGASIPTAEMDVRVGGTRLHRCHGRCRGQRRVTGREKCHVDHTKRDPDADRVSTDESAEGAAAEHHSTHRRGDRQMTRAEDKGVSAGTFFRCRGDLERSRAASLGSTNAKPPPTGLTH